MATATSQSLPIEVHDIFRVMQVTRGTALENLVGADLVDVPPGQTSQIHRHNLAETVLYILSGSGIIVVSDTDHAVSTGDRILIRAGEYHGVRTLDDSLRFLSVQSPPILDEEAGRFDLEPR